LSDWLAPMIFNMEKRFSTNSRALRSKFASSLVLSQLGLHSHPCRAASGGENIRREWPLFNGLGDRR
jgi:hypothetical protein